MGLIYAKGVYLGVRTYELFFFFGLYLGSLCFSSLTCSTGSYTGDEKA